MKYRSQYIVIIYFIFVYPVVLAHPLAVAESTSGDQIAGRVLAAEYFPDATGSAQRLSLVVQVTRQGDNSLMSADPANLVGSIIVGHCSGPPAETLQSTALLLATYATSNWQTDVELALGEKKPVAGVANFRISSLVMPFPRSQPPLQLQCSD